MRGADLIDVDIHGDVENLFINEVDVAPLIEAELDRRYPDRVKMRPMTQTGSATRGTSWTISGRKPLLGRADLPPAQLNDRVNGEWSFIETLRHLVLRHRLLDSARDSRGSVTVGPARSGRPTSFATTRHLLATIDARPSLDEVLELRRGRTATVRDYLADSH